MKFVHLSDLHIGKKLLGYSLTDDQEHILGQILSIIRDEKPDAVLIAGDVYDKSVPSGDAVLLFDRFLTDLTGLTGRVFVSAGNHDSAERLSFGRRLIAPSGALIAPVFEGAMPPAILRDGYGEVAVYMLPFIRSGDGRRAFPDEAIQSTDAAVRAVIRHMDVDPGRRNVLIAHQYVTGAVTSDSETMFVGGTDGVVMDAFEPFDYVALGHLHKPQFVGRESVRYCGAPLKYSIEERDSDKSVTVVELGEKGSVLIREVPLRPLRELRQLRGTYDELAAYAFNPDDPAFSRDDYIHAVLTDENDVPDAMARLRAVYPRLLKISYDNARTRSGGVIEPRAETMRLEGVDLFAEFYQMQNGQPLSDEQRAYAESLFREAGEDLI